MNTEGPLFYYYMFICGSFGSKISGFQKTDRRISVKMITKPRNDTERDI